MNNKIGYHLWINVSPSQILESWCLNSPIVGTNVTIHCKGYYNNYGLIFQSLEHLCHFVLKKLIYLYQTLRRLYLSFVHDYKQQISQFSASHDWKKISNSFLEHFCSTKSFTNLKLLYHLYETRSHFDHQSYVKESTLGKSIILIFL